MDVGTGGQGEVALPHPPALMMFNISPMTYGKKRVENVISQHFESSAPLGEHTLGGSRHILIHTIVID